MRRLLHAFFALAVFTTASGSVSTLGTDSRRSCTSGCERPKGVDAAAPHSCCGGMPEPAGQEAETGPSCPSHSTKCGITPAASIQFGLVKGCAAQDQDASLRAKTPEPRPWPLTMAETWQDATSHRLLSSSPALLRGSRAWAEACLPGGRALDHLARLSVFRI